MKSVGTVICISMSSAMEVLCLITVIMHCPSNVKNSHNVSGSTCF